LATEARLLATPGGWSERRCSVYRYRTICPAGADSTRIPERNGRFPGIAYVIERRPAPPDRRASAV